MRRLKIAILLLASLAGCQTPIPDRGPWVAEFTRYCETRKAELLALGRPVNPTDCPTLASDYYAAEEARLTQANAEAPQRTLEGVRFVLGAMLFGAAAGLAHGATAPRPVIHRTTIVVPRAQPVLVLPRR